MTESRAVNPPTSSVDGAAELEMTADSEPDPGNKQSAEAEQDPTPEMPDAANGLNENKSSGNANST